VQEAAPPPPSLPTASLTAEPATIESGQAVTLQWSTTDATAATISSLGTVAVEGKRQVRPEKSITYELVATGAGGTVTASATVTVVRAPPPVVAPPPAPRRSLSDRVEAELGDVYFDYDRSGLGEGARAALATDAEALRSIFVEFPDAVIVLEGHCDERGSAEYNIALGDRRAASARAYLEAIGISSTRLRSISYGKERPQCVDSTEACWNKNRRVHFAAAPAGTN
jgi:peptidoglycan-associated lipoprotein